MKIQTPRVRSAQTAKNPHPSRYLKTYYYFRIFVSLSVCFLPISRTWQDGFNLSFIFPSQKPLYLSILERVEDLHLQYWHVCLPIRCAPILQKYQTERKRVKLRSTLDPLDVGVGDPKNWNGSRSMKNTKGISSTRIFECATSNALSERSHSMFRTSTTYPAICQLPSAPYVAKNDKMIDLWVRFHKRSLRFFKVVGKTTE